MRLNLAAALAAIVLIAAGDAPDGWNLATFENQSTLEFYTVNGSGDGHWSTVWVAVVDGAPYLRLGSGATKRIEQNVGAPYVKIRIGGQEFDRVKAEPAPDMADRVKSAMADKYTWGLWISLESNVLIVRLVPEVAPPNI